MSNNRIFLAALCAILTGAYAHGSTHSVQNETKDPQVQVDARLTAGSFSHYMVLMDGQRNYYNTGKNDLDFVGVKIFDQRGNCLDPDTRKRMFYIGISAKEGGNDCSFYVESTPSAGHGWPYQVTESTGRQTLRHVPYSNKSCPSGLVAK